jgi:hypothetical protein
VFVLPQLESAFLFQLPVEQVAAAFRSAERSLLHSLMATA